MEIVICEESYKMLKEDIKLKRSLSFRNSKLNKDMVGYTGEIYIDWGTTSHNTISPMKKESSFDDILVVDGGFGIIENNANQIFFNNKRK